MIIRTRWRGGTYTEEKLSGRNERKKTISWIANYYKRRLAE